MPPEPSPRNPAYRIVLIYVLVSAAWILLSDRAVALVAPDLAWATRLSIAKGWAFVVFTAGLLYLFIRRSFRAEAAIREVLAASEARFSRAFHANPSPVAISREEDGLFLAVNGSFCRMMGLPADALLGRTAPEAGIYADPGDRERLLAALQREGSLRDQEVTFRTGGGRLLQVLLSVERIELDGRPCLLSAFRDLTLQRENEAERRRLEAEVQHVQKLESLGTLAGGVAHDMNNILGAVMGVASLVQETHQADPRLTRDMETLLRAATRGRDLVRGLTDFARKGLQEAQPTDLNEILAREADLLRRTTLNRIEVHLDLAESLPPVNGDPSALSNVVMNLCVNAVHAMPEGGQLRLASRRSGADRVEVAIADTGLGMPPEVLARAMEPFFTTKPQGQGTGLGLSLAYGVAKAHGGTLEIASEVGKGTVVRMLLPAVMAQPGEAQDSADAALPGPQAGLDILLVDDDELLRGAVPVMLQALGHRSRQAASGIEALDHLAAGPTPDLVLLDVNMPGMDGLEVLRRLRAGHPRLPVLLVSGLKDTRLEGLLSADPAVAYLAKPFTLAELSGRLTALGRS